VCMLLLCTAYVRCRSRTYHESDSSHCTAYHKAHHSAHSCPWLIRSSSKRNSSSREEVQALTRVAQHSTYCSCTAWPSTDGRPPYTHTSALRSIRTHSHIARGMMPVTTCLECIPHKHDQTHRLHSKPLCTAHSRPAIHGQTVPPTTPTVQHRQHPRDSSSKKRRYRQPKTQVCG
jgi:hypothetical protein